MRYLRGWIHYPSGVQTTNANGTIRMGLYDEEMNLVVETGAFTNAMRGGMISGFRTAT
jgi:hypothetical protein